MAETPPPSLAGNYRLIQLANGKHSLHSLDYGETCHPAIGPAAEAQALYVDQLGLAERLARHVGEFVIWDVGLGGGANALAMLRATEKSSCSLRLVSFDETLAPLEFALAHADALGYFNEHEPVVAELLKAGEVTFHQNSRRLHWTVHLGDFPSLLFRPEAQSWLKPNAILFDPFSPAKNPAMWTASLFARLYELLDPKKPCALATYSRSTMLRVALLLAGFFVGAGYAIGSKEETTIAANASELIESPLFTRWLQRARQSTSAEPLWDANYRRAKLTDDTWERLRQCRQFR